jgi:preprotein translocase subunit YajC
MIDSLVNFVISPAYADGPVAGPQAGGGMSLVMMFGVFILFMYFAVWRPQSKRSKQQRAMLEAITKGDEVVTAGGILGRVSKVSDQYLVLALDENVEVTIQKSSIVSALPKGTMKSVT